MRNIALVLTVTMILVICGGLVVCGISKIRHVAGRTQCANNNRQIGLAVHNFTDSFKEFPRAGLPNPDFRPEDRLSWIVSILPYVESDPLYSRIDRKLGWKVEENRFAALTSLYYLRCPYFPDQPPVSTLVPTHYVGITGIGTDAIELPKGDPRAGLFGFERKLDWKELVGRTSTLLMVVETTRAQGSWIAAGFPTARGLDPMELPYLGRDRQFGGIHGRGVNVLLADGSVRFLPDNMDPKVWEAMATIQGPRPFFPE
jgi:prepilin-type processing-associated H-X9-DG protein